MRDGVVVVVVVVVVVLLSVGCVCWVCVRRRIGDGIWRWERERERGGRKKKHKNKEGGQVMTSMMSLKKKRKCIRSERFGWVFFFLVGEWEGDDELNTARLVGGRGRKTSRTKKHWEDAEMRKMMRGWKIFFFSIFFDSETFKKAFHVCNSRMRWSKMCVKVAFVQKRGCLKKKGGCDIENVKKKISLNVHPGSQAGEKKNNNAGIIFKVQAMRWNLSLFLWWWWRMRQMWKFCVASFLRQDDFLEGGVKKKLRTVKAGGK